MRSLPAPIGRAARRFGPALAITALAGAANAQQFQYQVGWIPGPARWTEGVEAADVENDGDLDLFFADGDGFSTPSTKRQNVLVINKLVETGPGVFADESVARLGVSVSNAKMVVTGDIQGDGLIDALFCNAFNNDLPFLFVNQAGNPGFFNKESAARGLTTMLNSAGAQFGDLDNDGDLDLIITDSGPSFFGGAGGRPHLYLNDGNGFFTEDAVKLNAPLKTAHMDVQLVDVDNDWTLDFYGVCRAANAGGTHYLMLNDGSASFTNVSTIIPTTSSSVYESEMADLDGDTDLDNFFVSLTGLSEGLHRNNLIQTGNLSYTAGPAIGGGDDNEVALLDVDNDGDYDALIGALTGNTEKFIRNDGGLVFTQVAGAFSLNSDSTLDITVADLDNDGRYDVVSAQGESNQATWINKVYKNTGSVDNRPPVIVREEPLANPTATGPWVVRTVVRDQVLDDAKNWVTGSADYVVNTAPMTQTISITGMSFPAMSVPAGTTVTWVNNSALPHNVTSTTAGYEFTSPNFGNGGSYSYTFVRPGVYTYTCTLHPGMNGTLTVTGSSSQANVVYQAGSMYRVAMTDTTGGNGVELVWETRFVDWAGNVTVSPSKRVPLPRSCGFTDYGVGSSPVNDLVLAGSGDGAIGGQAILTVSNPGPIGTFDAISLGQFSFPLFGGELLIDPTILVGPFFVATVAGTTTMVLPLANDPALVGLNVYFQAFGPDVTKPEGVALSNGVRLEICQ